LGRQKISIADSCIASLMVGFGRLVPFPVPGFLILRVYTARREEAFGNSRAAFLSSTQKPQKFSRQIFTVRPVDPSVLVKATDRIGHQT
jgi:hypothetical protein